MKRLSLLVFCVLTLLMGWVVFTSNPGASINRATTGSIKAGMTEEELMKVFGLPAGNYATGPVDVDLQTVEQSGVPQSLEKSLGQIPKTSSSDFAHVFVYFDDDGKVERWCVGNSPGGPRTPPVFFTMPMLQKRGWADCRSWWYTLATLMTPAGRAFVAEPTL